MGILGFSSVTWDYSKKIHCRFLSLSLEIEMVPNFFNTIFLFPLKSYSNLNLNFVLLKSYCPCLVLRYDILTYTVIITLVVFRLLLSLEFPIYLLIITDFTFL